MAAFYEGLWRTKRRAAMPVAARWGGNRWSASLHIKHFDVTGGTLERHSLITDAELARLALGKLHVPAAIGAALAP
jgi:hypothetical protein